MNNLNPRWRGLFVVVAVLVCRRRPAGRLRQEEHQHHRQRGHAQGRRHATTSRSARTRRHRAAEQALGVGGQPGRASGLPGSHAVLVQPDGSMKAVPCIAESCTTSPDLHDLHVPAQARRHVPAAGQPRGHGSGLRGLLELGHQPQRRSHVSYFLAPVQGCRRRRLLDQLQASHRRQGARQVHPAGQAALPVRRVPADAGSPP